MKRSYLVQEKGITIRAADDTDQSPDIPSTISSALMRRLDAPTQLERLETIAARIVKETRK